MGLLTARKRAILEPRNASITRTYFKKTSRASGYFLQILSFFREMGRILIFLFFWQARSPNQGAIYASI